MDNNLYPSETWCIYSSCGKFYLIIDFDGSRDYIVRVDISAGKAGGCASAHLVPLARRITEVIKKSNTTEKILALTEMTSTRCHLPDNCIALIAHRLLEVELSLSERRRKRGKK